MIEISPKVKAWTEGVLFEEQAQEQVKKMASLAFVRPYVAVMPDVQYEAHGATVGTVIPSVGAIIPAAVSVDIGCGVSAIKTSLTQAQLPDSLQELYSELEQNIPVGQAAWPYTPTSIEHQFLPYVKDYHALAVKHPKIDGPKLMEQVGTLGGGNHFVEIDVDASNDLVWVMVHSGSRGIGNRIGRYFIDKAKEAMVQMNITDLPHPDLAYLVEGDPLFKDYVRAVSWAQDYAALNRRVILSQALLAMHKCLPPFAEATAVVSCHHNYVIREKHFNQDVWVTRKGAIYAGKGAKGIIPGSMGTPSFVVEGLGNTRAFNSASHGAGRLMSRGKAKATITMEKHAADTEDIACRKDQAILDESPSAYKDIHAVMAAQADLVQVTAELHPVLVLKG